MFFVRFKILLPLFLLRAASSWTPPEAELAPCDLYAAGGTPCVAAHSTTRALFAHYNGPLFEVVRSSDKVALFHDHFLY